MKIKDFPKFFFYKIQLKSMIINGNILEEFQKIGKIFKPKKHKQEKDCIDEMSALNDDENENLKVNSLENENEKLDNKLLVKRVKEAEDMITFLQKTIEDLKTKVNHLQNALEKKEYELNIKKNEVMSLLDEIKKLTSQMGNQKELVKIIEKIREEKEIYKNESAQKSLEIEKYQENLKNLNEEHNIEREKHNEQKEKLNTTKAIKKDLKIKNKELEENLSKIQTKYNKKKEQLKSSKDFQKNYENLHSDYDNMKKEYNIFLTNLGLIENKEKKKHSKAKSKSSPTFSSPYDMIINIDSLKTQIQGWEIEMSKFALENHNSKSEYSIIGLVGRENIGKTFILNKICGFDLPSGSNVNTKGLSMKYSNQQDIICLDSAGIQTPVYYYEPKLLDRFGVNKAQLKLNDELKQQMINDRTLTDIFIQDFILEVCEVIVIVVGQLSQNDQKFIERISMRYKSKKRIIIIHNFSNLYSVQDVEHKIEKDIIKAFDTVSRCLASSDLLEYIEKNPDKTKENISHLVLGVDWSDSGKKYNEITFEYLRDILNTRIDKRRFNIINQLKGFFEDNYRLYLQMKKLPKKKVTLKYDEESSVLMIDSDQDYEISNPMFNSLGSLITNPPYEIFVKMDRYVVLVELPDLDLKSLQMKINKKTEFNLLSIKGVKNHCEEGKKDDNMKIIEMRSYGEFSCLIPLGKRHELFGSIQEKGYQDGLLMVEVSVKEDEEEKL